MHPSSFKIPKDQDLYWLAGLLEGEGCFRNHYNGHCTIQLGMTDQDVVERVGGFFGSKIYYRQNLPPRKDSYEARVAGHKAYLLMQALLPLMGLRRASKIREALFIHENRPLKGRNGQRSWNEGLVGPKLSDVQVKQILVEWHADSSYGKQSELARKYDVTSQRIGQIVRGTARRGAEGISL